MEDLFLILAVIFAVAMIILMIKYAKFIHSQAGVDSKKMKRTDSEWKRILTSAEYHILREKGTERAFTGEYDGHFEEGTYVCSGCGNKIFDSETKYRLIMAASE